MNSRRSPLFSFAVSTLAVVLAGTLAALAAPAAQADIKPAFGIGATSIARPASSGGRYIYVDGARGADLAYDPTGMQPGEPPWPRQDCLFDARKPYWARHNGRSQRENCPEPDSTHPMRTVRVAIYASRPGDVIVVRGGTYNEAISTTGDGRTDHKGTSTSKRLVLQNYPGESVRLNGYINFQDPDYWTVTGLRFGYNSSITGRRNYIVGMFGGTGWIFNRNEVAGGRGNSNMLVSFSGPAPSTTTAPRSWVVSQNCIHDNYGTNPGSTDHNLYVKPSIHSRTGYIQRNLMWNAPNGGNIKLGGSRNPDEAPAYVTVRDNTLLRSGSGVVVGQKANHILISSNVIGLPVSTNRDDGGIKTYSMRYPSTVNVNDNYIAGWKNYIRETGTRPYGRVTRRNNKVWDQRISGTYTGCAVVAASTTVRNGWGHKAN